ncbi:MAG: hypothetical protein WBG43_06140 [Marinifilaceae bacterium]
MKIKYTTLVIIFSFICFYYNVSAQNNLTKSDDLGRIILNTYISDKIVSLPKGAKRLLSSRITKIASKNGVGGSASNPRFIITPNINILTKDITPTAPPMIAMTLDVSIYVGDGIDGTMFASESIEVKGIGTNETKAYISAIKQIRAKNPRFQNLVKVAKKKIIEYYNSRCDFILSEANALASKEDFDEAILKLTSVPEVCKECYDKCMEAVGPIYKKKIDKESSIKLAQANAAWNAGQNLEAANNAKEFITDINPSYSYYSKVENLSETISKKIRAIEKRDWDFKLKKYNDQLELDKSKVANQGIKNKEEAEINKSNAKANNLLKKARLAVSKEILQRNTNLIYDINSWW